MSHQRQPNPLCISLSMPLREVCLWGQRHVSGRLLVSSFTPACGVHSGMQCPHCPRCRPHNRANP